MEESKTLKFTKASNCQVLISTGALGGINNNGLLEINFYLDKINIEGSLKFPADSNKIENIGTVKEIQSTIYMDHSSAKAFSKWLENQLNDFEKTKK